MLDIGSAIQRWRTGNAAALAATDQKDMRALHASLGDASRCTLLMFHSKSCRLCRSVRGAADRALRSRRDEEEAVGDSGRDEASGTTRKRRGLGGGGGGRRCLRVDTIEVDAESRTWRPEATHFGVTRVPCFILLGRDGRAVCRTSNDATRSRESILAALELLLREVT